MWLYGAVVVGAAGGYKAKVVCQGFDVNFVLAAVSGVIYLDAFEAGLFEAVYKSVELIVRKIIKQRVCQNRYAAGFFYAGNGLLR